ncbi:MAG: tetratricopeptide repeat protein [Deltaproteobacteria bacterium]
MKRAIWIACVAVMAVATRAHAQDDGGRAAYVKATRYFEAEEFRAALPYFERAYEQSGHRPATIFGLAQCLRSLRRYEDAIVYFKEYIATEPDNASEVRETLTLLEEIAAKQRRDREAEAAKKAEEDKRAEEAAALRQREEAEQREAERAAAIAEAEARAREAAEAVIESAPPPPPTAAVATAPAPAPQDDGSVLSSPVFWIITGAAVVGGAVALGVVATSQESTYGGTADVVLQPLGGRR